MEEIYPEGNGNTRHLRKHTNLWRISLSSLAVLILVVAAVVSARYLSSLRSLVNRANTELAFLADPSNLESSSGKQDSTIIQLTDSLRLLSERLLQVDNVISDYYARKKVEEKVYLAKCKEIDRQIADFESRVMPQFTHRVPAFDDSIMNLTIRLTKITREIDRKRIHKELHDDDRLRLSDRVGGYYSAVSTESLRTWLNKLNFWSETPLTDSVNTTK